MATSTNSEAPYLRPNDSKELYLLTLDGGGIRGLSTLYILKHLMELIDPVNPPKPCECFDMIGGTSTGGLIAIMLGRLSMGVEDCIQEYLDLAPKIFKKKRHRLNLGGHLQGRFDSEALEDGVRNLLERRVLNQIDAKIKEKLQGKIKERLPGNPGTADMGEKDQAKIARKHNALLKGSSNICRTFVCATSKSTSKPVVFSSYFSRRRGLDMLNEAKIWEVARATAAATSFFDEITINHETFLDGATGANCPVNTMWTEATDIWRDRDDPSWNLEDHVKCFVSIGTGMPALKPFSDSIRGIGKTLVAIATDSENTVENFKVHHPSLMNTRRFFRFNVPHGLESVGLEEVNKQAGIVAATREYIKGDNVLHQAEHCANIISHRNWIPRTLLSIKAVAKSRRAEYNTLQSSVSDRSDDLSWFVNTRVCDKWLYPKNPHDNIMWHSIETDTRPPCKSLAGLGVARILHRSHSEQSQDPEVAYARCSRFLPGGTESPQTPSNSLSMDPLDIIWPLVCQLLSCRCDRDNETEQRLSTLVKAEEKHKELIKELTADPGRSSEIPYGPNNFMALLDAALKIRNSTNLLIIVEAVENMDTAGLALFTRSFCEILEGINSEHVGGRVHLLITGAAMEHVRNALASYNTVDKNTEYKECLESLEFTELHRRRNHVTTAESGTTQWLWTHPSYQAWEQEGGILWIRGKPGSGKSVLAKTIQKHYSKISAGKDSQLIVGDWFYSARGGLTGMMHQYMLRSLLFEILCQNRYLFAYAQAAYRSARKLQLDLGEPGTPWGTKSLENAMMQIASIKVTDIEIVCIIDAVDESEDGANNFSRGSDVLSFFSTLVSIAQPAFRIILLSRPAPRIEKKFKYCYQILVEAENRQDIETIVDCKLQSLRSTWISLFESSDEDRPRPLAMKRLRMRDSSTKLMSQEEGEIQKIRDYVLENAQGVTLWVILILKELENIVQNGGFKLSQLRQKLLDLPTGLHELYQVIVKNIMASQQPNVSERGRKILSWTIGASAKKTVRLHDLLEVLAIPEEVELAIKSVEDPLLTNRIHFPKHYWNFFRRLIYSYCGPFIEIVAPETFRAEGHSLWEFQDTRSDWIVQLLHQTVKDFLADPCAAGPLHIDVNETWATVEVMSLRYLQICLPLERTAYTPIPGGLYDASCTKTRQIVEYLDEKYLLKFVLTILPDLSGDIAHSYQEAFKNSFFSNHNWLFARFLHRCDLNRIEFLLRKKPVPGSQFFTIACINGYSTAVTNLLAATQLSPRSWKNMRSAVLHNMVRLVIKYNFVNLEIPLLDRFLACTKNLSLNRVFLILEAAKSRGRVHLVDAIFEHLLDQRDERASISRTNYEWAEWSKETGDNKVARYNGSGDSQLPVIEIEKAITLVLDNG